MKEASLLLFSAFLVSTPVCAIDIDADIELLDKEVAMSSFYVKAKVVEIARLKGNYKVASSSIDKYLSCKQIVEAYAKFNNDSALVYLQQCMKMGKQERRKDWVQETTLTGSFIYADRGDDFISTSYLNQLGSIDEVLPIYKELYAKASLMRFIRVSLSQKDETNIRAAVAAWNQYSPYLTRHSIYYNVFYIACHPTYDARILEQSQRDVLTHVKPYSGDDALGRMLLYQILEKQGKSDLAFHELIRSAVGDIRMANRSSESLLRITELLSNSSGHTDHTQRLLNYIQLCTANVSIYNDVGRSVKLVNVSKKIQANYLAALSTKQTFLTIALVIVFLLGCIVVYLLRKSSKKYAFHKNGYQLLRAEADDLNQQITERDSHIALLEGERLELKQQVEKTDAIVAKVFGLMALFLRDMRAYKKDMANYLQTGMLREAKKLANGGVSKDNSVGNMYERFDDAFLTLHPDFVQRFNSVLRPEFRVIPENERSLTPEMRIYALICLGVTDSVNIAEILQYSTQTVYNYRLKVRHETVEPNFKIADYISNMYRIEAGEAVAE